MRSAIITLLLKIVSQRYTKPLTAALWCNCLWGSPKMGHPDPKAGHANAHHCILKDNHMKLSKWRPRQDSNLQQPA